jgi:hypothetical protein
VCFSSSVLPAIFLLRATTQLAGGRIRTRFAVPAAILVRFTRAGHLLTSSGGVAAAATARRTAIVTIIVVRAGGGNGCGDCGKDALGVGTAAAVPAFATIQIRLTRTFRNDRLFLTRAQSGQG